jgi:thiamine monophosphate synthase
LSIAGPDYIKAALPILDDAAIPHVAIGGIDQTNLAALLDLDVKTVAVSTAVCNTENPEQSCKALKKMLLG